MINDLCDVIPLLDDLLRQHGKEVGIHSVSFDGSGSDNEVMFCTGYGGEKRSWRITSSGKFHEATA